MVTGIISSSNAQVNGRRKRLQVKTIQNSGGQWLETTEDMAEEAVNFFQAQFHKDKVPTTFGILDHVPSMVEMGQNDNLIKQPTKEEVKKAVFGLNGDSVGGPDGFNECFYQTCWEIISEDIFYMVRAFLNVQ